MSFSLNNYSLRTFRIQKPGIRGLFVARLGLMLMLSVSFSLMNAQSRFLTKGHGGTSLEGGVVTGLYGGLMENSVGVSRGGILDLQVQTSTRIVDHLSGDVIDERLEINLGFTAGLMVIKQDSGHMPFSTFVSAGLGQGSVLTVRISKPPGTNATTWWGTEAGVTTFQPINAGINIAPSIAVQYTNPLNNKSGGITFVHLSIPVLFQKEGSNGVGLIPGVSLSDAAPVYQLGLMYLFME